MPPPPRALPEELLEEILLRLPPDDPGCLFRASLVCKPWRSRLTGSAFPRRYREFHGTPPLLGFFENDFSACCWVLHYGRLSTMCISAYYKYGLALLYEAQSKIAPHQRLVKGVASKDDTRSTKASGSNIWEGDTRKDLDLAWKMLHIARTILEKRPCIPMEKVEIFSSLAEVSMEREDIDYSLRAWLKALAILEHLVEPDHCRIILINLHIFLAFNSASKIGDAIPYGVKVISLYKSRMQKLKVAKEALLADKGDNASAAEVDSENSFLDILTSIFTVLEKKLEDLAQAMLTPISKASGVHNVGYVVPGAASLTSQIAGPSNSMCRAATIETPNLGTACHASNNLISSRSLLNLVARNFA